MSNVNYVPLGGSPKVVLNAISPKHYKICLLCAYTFYSSRSIPHLSHKKHIARPVGFFTNQIRFTTHSQHDRGAKVNSQHDRSSTTHQGFHRRAYERKRSTYQEDKQNKSSGTVAIPFRKDINHYQRLNIEPKANLSDIKSAYYSLSKLYHPDVRGSEDTQAEENFRLITESYDILSNANTRSDYDKQLDLENQVTGSDLSWKPSNKNNTSSDPVFRMRDADLIFRQKQEAAFLEEKRKNPEKFRAGSFTKNDSDPIDFDYELKKVEKQINNLGSFRSRSGSTSDANDFYRQHLRDTLLRKRTDINEARGQFRPSPAASNEGALLLSILGVGVIVVMYSLGVLYKVDIADQLDTSFERKLKEYQQKKEM